MALKGNLADFSTTQILNLIHLARKTGTLRLFEPVLTGETMLDGAGNKRPRIVAGKERATVAFHEGKLILAAMGDQDGHLANVLHKAGKLNTEQARIIRERGAKYSDKALALMLINANYVTQADVVRSIKQHTVDIVYDVMTWEREPFLFEENLTPPQDRTSTWRSSSPRRRARSSAGFTSASKSGASCPISTRRIRSARSPKRAT